MGTAAHMNARAVSTIRDAFGKCHASCPFQLILFVPQPRARVGRFLDGTLAGDGRRNGWQLAEAAHDATPYGMCSGSTVSTTGIGRVT